jgi:hypothetical protein
MAAPAFRLDVMKLVDQWRGTMQGRVRTSRVRVNKSVRMTHGVTFGSGGWQRYAGSEYNSRKLLMIATCCCFNAYPVAVVFALVGTITCTDPTLPSVLHHFALFALDRPCDASRRFAVAASEWNDSNTNTSAAIADR